MLQIMTSHLVFLWLENCVKRWNFIWCFQHHHNTFLGNEESSTLPRVHLWILCANTEAAQWNCVRQKWIWLILFRKNPNCTFPTKHAQTNIEMTVTYHSLLFRDLENSSSWKLFSNLQKAVFCSSKFFSSLTQAQPAIEHQILSSTNHTVTKP